MRGLIRNWRRHRNSPDSEAFSRLREELIRKYGMTSYFIAFGGPISDRYGSVLYISGHSASLKEFVRENPQWRDIRLSSLLRYRLKRAGYGVDGHHSPSPAGG